MSRFILQAIWKGKDVAIKIIMLVDDNETDQFLSEMVIEKFDPGIEVVKAYDGQEALDLLSDASEQPDVILLDINMPGMNGFEFLEEYSKDPSPSVVIAMLSSSEQGDDREKALAYDCVVSYLVKPIDASDLESLRNCVAAWRGAERNRLERRFC